MTIHDISCYLQHGLCDMIDANETKSCRHFRNINQDDSTGTHSYNIYCHMFYSILSRAHGISPVEMFIPSTMGIVAVSRNC